MTTSYTEFPSGRVLCCMRHDTGAIVCTSDATYGPFVVRAQEALQKAENAYANYKAIQDYYNDDRPFAVANRAFGMFPPQPVGRIVDVVV